MSDPHETPRPVRLRTATAKAKALAQYEELRRSGRVKSAVIIAELTDGSWQILGQRMTPGDMTLALVLAADALQHATGPCAHCGNEVIQVPVDP